MSGAGGPIQLNRLIATQRRLIQSQQQQVRPSKVPFWQPGEDDVYSVKSGNQSPKHSQRPVSTGRFVSSPLKSIVF
jgi:hypothetical protein